MGPPGFDGHSDSRWARSQTSSMT